MATNNVAEYRALILGLERAARWAQTEVEVVNDSELVAKQIQAQYKVKHPDMKPLYLEAWPRSAALSAGRSAACREHRTPTPTRWLTPRSTPPDLAQLDRLRALRDRQHLLVGERGEQRVVDPVDRAGALPRHHPQVPASTYSW